MNYEIRYVRGHVEVYDQMGPLPVLRRLRVGGAGGAGAGLRRIETKQQARPAMPGAPAHMRELFQSGI